MAKPSAACEIISSPTGTSGSKSMYKPYNIINIPDIPAIPNPGITRPSRSNKPIPVIIIKKSVIVASLAMYEALKDNARQAKPTNPGMPHPGLCNSNNIPRKPNVVNKEATTGFVRKRTTFSDQFSSIFIISTSYNQ